MAGELGNVALGGVDNRQPLVQGAQRLASPLGGIADALAQAKADLVKAVIERSREMGVMVR